MVCTAVLLFFFFKQKTAYEMRISDWSSDVCSSDLLRRIAELLGRRGNHLDDAGDVVDPGGDRLDAARRLPRHGLPAADLYRDVLRRLRRLVRQVLDLAGHHGESLSGLARPRRLDRGVEREIGRAHV